MARQRRGTRAFLRQVGDELPSHLPPRLRAFSSEQWGRFYKVWYGPEKNVHFEVQFLSGGRLEIGLHLEADGETNERVARVLERRLLSIRRGLGEDAALGSHGSSWRSLAERWSGGDLRGEEAATEATARLAAYVVALAPIVDKALETKPRGGRLPAATRRSRSPSPRARSSAR